MTKRFLGAWGDPAHLQIEVTDAPAELLARPHGRVAGLHPARPTGPDLQVPSDSTIVFLVASKPAELLASLANDFNTAPIIDNTYVSHGHSSVVLVLADAYDWERVYAVVEDMLIGYEVWPVVNSQVQVSDITCVEPSLDDMPSVPAISTDGLGFESVAQVRQFNANLAVISRSIWGYAPEIWPLVERLGGLAAQIANTLTEPGSTDAMTADMIRRRIHAETALVETNAVVSLYCSQLASGTMPLHQTTFPVGEYSLLGIGGMCRGAWRLYHHLNQTFAKYDHATVLRTKYPIMQPFYPYGASDGARDFSTWRSGPYTLESHTEENKEPRYHVPYFSSRWGFHESLHSISLSWQCLFASATKEWNLLTLTHEFLHSQVRAIFGEILRANAPGTPPADTNDDPQPSDDLAARIVKQYNNRENGTSALESLQIAYADMLVVYDNANLSYRDFDSTAAALDLDFDSTLTVDQLRDLVRQHSGLLHEIAVHVLDFRYVYAGSDVDYINSIWSSWSLVPSVADRIDHYVLRTLCALSANTHDRDNANLFNDARDRMKAALEPLACRVEDRPAIAQAIALLNDDASCRRLQLVFHALQYAVELTNTFFHDNRLNTALLDDPAMVYAGDEFSYDLQPGDYSGVDIASPIRFLLDRFPHYSDHAGADTEFESIWQMLQLI